MKSLRIELTDLLARAAGDESEHAQTARAQAPAVKRQQKLGEPVGPRSSSGDPGGSSTTARRGMLGGWVTPEFGG